jgi:hypothetical protein
LVGNDFMKKIVVMLSLMILSDLTNNIFLGL